MSPRRKKSLIESIISAIKDFFTPTRLVLVPIKKNPPAKPRGKK